MRLAVLAALFAAAYAAPVGKEVDLFQSGSWITYGGETDSAATKAADSAFALHAHVERQLSKGHYVPAKSAVDETRLTTGGDLKTTVRTKLCHFEITVADRPKHLDALPAIRLAASVVEHSWPSAVPVHMRIGFASLGGGNVLANGGGTHFARMNSVFKEIVPVAAAESFLGKDFNAKEKGNGKYDVLVTVNTNTPWYLGIDGRPPPSQYDLATVILHEIYHNLIFTGGIFVEKAPNPAAAAGLHQEASIQDNLVTRFDSFLANRAGCQVLNYLKDAQLQRTTGRSGNELLAQAVANDSLYFGFQSFGKLVKLHAPRVFLAKSSIYHIDPATAGADSIMAPVIRPGRSQHSIGPVIIRMQALFLDPEVRGANTNCPLPLADPAPLGGAQSRTGDISLPANHPTLKPGEEPLGGVLFDQGLGTGGVGTRIRRGLSRGAIIALSVLGGLLLLLLYLALIAFVIVSMKKKPKPAPLGDSGMYGDAEETYYDEQGGKVPSGSNHYPPSKSHGPSVYPPPPPVAKPGACGGSRRSSSRHSSSKRVPSVAPTSTKRPAPPSCRPPSSRAPSSSKHSRSHKPSSRAPSTKPPTVRPPSSRAPSTRKASSRAPKTEDYFDCS